MSLSTLTTVLTGTTFESLEESKPAKTAGFSSSPMASNSVLNSSVSLISKVPYWKPGSPLAATNESCTSSVERTFPSMSKLRTRYV